MAAGPANGLGFSFALQFLGAGAQARNFAGAQQQRDRKGNSQATVGRAVRCHHSCIIGSLAGK